jgi:hypothetical protein
VKKRDFNWIANVALYSGAVLCIVSVLLKLQGSQLLFGSKPISVFILGVGLMVFNCAVKLETKH